MRDQLIEFLSTRRWFGEKGVEIRDARLADVIPVSWPGSEKEFAVARAEVVTDSGMVRYQLFLHGESLEGDALEDPDFRRGLADAFARGATFESVGSRWIVEGEGEAPLVVPSAEEITLGSAEQSNSSVIIGSEAMLKLYRKLQPGINPDVEVTRFLTRERGFSHVPVLLGTIRFEDAAAAGGNVTIAGMLTEYVPGARDGWTFALECSKGYFAAPASEDPEHPFRTDAEQLGELTRAMHVALASGAPHTDFAPLHGRREDVGAWSRQATAMVERACDTLARALSKKQLPRERVAEAEATLGRRRSFVEWLEDVAKGVGEDAGARARTHGDYHLGQVLRSAAKQFLVIDFEGEPARPLEERRARNSPLRDVAGMLRSFAYVALTAGYQIPGSERRDDPRTTEVRMARWERGAREAFLDAYFGEDTGELLPRSRENAGRLIALFEAEKVFYELQYELDHRPEWAWIPLRGIAKLFT